MAIHSFRAYCMILEHKGRLYIKKTKLVVFTRDEIIRNLGGWLAMDIQHDPQFIISAAKDDPVISEFLSENNLYTERVSPAQLANLIGKPLEDVMKRCEQIRVFSKDNKLGMFEAEYIAMELGESIRFLSASDQTHMRETINLFRSYFSQWLVEKIAQPNWAGLRVVDLGPGDRQLVHFNVMSLVARHPTLTDRVVPGLIEHMSNDRPLMKKLMEYAGIVFDLRNHKEMVAFGNFRGLGGHEIVDEDYYSLGSGSTKGFRLIVRWIDKKKLDHMRIGNYHK